MVFRKRKRYFGDFDDIYSVFDFIEDTTRRMLRIVREFYERFPEYMYLPEEGYDIPYADIIDEGDKYVIEIDLPGVDKKDIDIRVYDRYLEIVAKRKTERKEEEEGYIRAERAFMGFMRRIVLPADADTEKIKAKYNNGVLTIIIPKKSERSGRRVEVE